MRRHGLHLVSAAALFTLAVAVSPAEAQSRAAEPSATGAPYTLSELQQRAHAAALASDPAWLRLVHYRSTLLGAHRSQADGPQFFLSAGGKTDPAQELDATIAALLEPEAPSGADHAQCRFPARLEWLVERLALDRSRLPRPACPKLQEWLDRTRAKSVTFAFSSYYLANPASVFGHTFLRLNRDEVTQDGKQKELLDWGVNFAGDVDTQSAFLYAWKGFTGGFRGTFASLPYFYKVREYNDFESRDVWEYRLSLTPAEVRRFVLHLWELGATWFDYFYVDENCSWHLLAALEAAAPRLELLRELKPEVLPGDAVKALFANVDLVESVHYRPSLREQFELRSSGLTTDELRAVKRLEAEPSFAFAAGDKAREARVLDAAMDYLDLVHAKALVYDSAPEVAARRHKLLVRRAKLGVPSPELPVQNDSSRAPHLSHGSMRLGVGGGVTSGSEQYVRLMFRGLLHDLADPRTGYPEHTVMEILSAEARYDVRRSSVALEDLQLVRVANHSPVTAFWSSTSWNVQAGVQRLRDGGCRGESSCLAGAVEGGAGVSVKPLGAPLLLYAFGNAQLAGGPELRGMLGAPVRPSAGPRLGVRWHLGDRYSTHLNAGAWAHWEQRAARLSWSAQWIHRVHLTRELSLDVDLRRNETGVEAAATAFFYF